MEQLLATARDNGDQSGGQTYSREANPQSSSGYRRSHGSSTSAAAVNEADGERKTAAQLEEEERARVALLEAAPAHVQDKEAVRNDLSSFREIANLTARSAITSYSEKMRHERMRAAGLLSALSFGACTILWLVGQSTVTSMSTGCWATAAIGVIMLCDFLIRRRFFTDVRNIAAKWFSVEGKTDEQ